MLQISRKIFSIPFNQVYFQELKCDSRFEPEIIYYIHVLRPSRKLQGQKTLHLDLAQDESTLYNGMSDRVKNALEEGKVENWTISRFEHPTDREIENFQQYYNSNAKRKNIRKLTNYDKQTLKLLREQGGLTITKIETGQKEAICYRLYAVSGEMVMALYNEGQELMNDKLKENADYLLCWENMKHFSRRGYRIYDFGDFKDLSKLEKSKENFGGEMVTVFSGYISKSLISQMLLRFNLKGLKKRLIF